MRKQSPKTNGAPRKSASKSKSRAAAIKPQRKTGKTGKITRKPAAKKRQRADRATTLEARERVLNEARRRGKITNDKARQIGRWSQAWYHLNKMAEEGVLKRADHNAWMPTNRRGRYASNSLSA